MLLVTLQWVEAMLLLLVLLLVSLFMLLLLLLLALVVGNRGLVRLLFTLKLRTHCLKLALQVLGVL